MWHPTFHFNMVLDIYNLDIFIHCYLFSHDYQDYLDGAACTGILIPPPQSGTPWVPMLQQEWLLPLTIFKTFLPLSGSHAHYICKTIIRWPLFPPNPLFSTSHHLSPLLQTNIITILHSHFTDTLTLMSFTSSLIRWQLSILWYHHRVAKDYPNCCHTILRRDWQCLYASEAVAVISLTRSQHVHKRT